jgi:aspartyl protease
MTSLFRLLCAVAVGCFITAPHVSARQGDRTPSNITAPSRAPKRVRSLPVFYDPGLAAQGFPSPLMKAEIAGHEALFIIDSGASANVLADWYAEVAQIPADETGSIAKGSGGKTSAARVAHQLQGHWSDGQRFSLNEAVVIAFPPLFKSLHLGGLLSPQLLAPVGTAAVLDLRIPSLQFAPFARALSDLQRSKSLPPPLTVTRACENADSKVVNRQYLAPVTTRDATDLVLVDTGATKTILSDESNIAHAIESLSELGPPSEGVGGEVSGRLIVRDVELLRGGRVVVLNPSIGKVSASCKAKGLLGMDALRDCLLILGDKEMALSCEGATSPLSGRHTTNSLELASFAK